jgi:hypothetical protein
MNAAADVLRMLAEWRTLTEREGDGISRGDWASVARTQELKAELRERLTPLFADIRTRDSQIPADGSREECMFDLLISELIGLETRNRDRLRARREDRKAERDRLNATVAGLRDLRRAYGGRATSHWQSFS